MGKMLAVLTLVILLPTSILAAEPYELKGDMLGMDIKFFKEKYRRSVAGHNEDAPFCSDSNPNKRITTLLSEDWHYQAGIVNCRTTFPFESYRGANPTVSGVATDMLIYHFVDGKLFKITTRFKHGGFQDVRNALLAKYGKSSDEIVEYKNRFGATFSGETKVWRNSVSSIELVERHGDLDSSVLFLKHKELDSVAKKRVPKPKAEDL